MLSLDQIKPNDTEAGTRSLSIIKLVMWEGQVIISKKLNCDCDRVTAIDNSAASTNLKTSS